MRHTFYLILFLLVSSPALAEDSIQLKFGYKANSSFVVRMEMVSDMDMSFEGNKENLPEQLRERFPTKIHGKSIIEESINAGQRSSDSSYPLEMVIQKHRKYFSLNNSEVTESPAPLEGAKLQGKVLADGGLQFVSVHGDKATSELEPIAKAVFAQLGNAGFFSGKNVRIGETISNRVPIQIPLKDNGKMSFEMQTQYRLKSIEGDIAYFDVSYSALVGAEVEAAKINVQLSGDGKMTYSISNQYSPESTTDISMQMNIPAYGGVLKNVSKSYSRTITSYKPN